jgi:AbrB family looped-hinge helix DNA binding protein
VIGLTTVTQKGQITIPVEIREKYHIRPGMRVRVRDTGRVIELEIPDEERYERADAEIRRIRGALKGRVSTDELMRLTRGEDWGRTD